MRLLLVPLALRGDLRRMLFVMVAALEPGRGRDRRRRQRPDDVPGPHSMLAWDRNHAAAGVLGAMMAEALRSLMDVPCRQRRPVGGVSLVSIGGFTRRISEDAR